MNREYINLTIAAGIFALFGVFARILGDTFTNLGQTFARIFIALLFVWILIVLRRVNLKAIKNDLLNLFLLALVVSISIFSFTITINEIKLSSAIFLLYAGSILASLFFGKVFLKERMTRRKGIAIFLTCFGLFIFALPLQLDALLMILIGLASGIFEGISNFIRKKLTHLSKVAVLFYQFLFGSFILGVAVLITSDKIVNKFSPEIALIILYGALIVLFNWIINRAFRKVDLTIGTLILCSEVLMSLLFGFFLFSEVPSLQELLGGILILAAFININVKFNNKS